MTMTRKDYVAVSDILSNYQDVMDSMTTMRWSWTLAR